MSVTITRPNGKVYRPRTITAQLLGNEDEIDAVVVLGTHDLATARATAKAELDDYMRQTDYLRGGYALQLEKERLVWWRAVPDGTGEAGELLLRYVDDEVKGRAGVRFTVCEVISNRSELDEPGETDPMPLPPAMFDVDEAVRS